MFCHIPFKELNYRKKRRRKLAKVLSDNHEKRGRWKKKFDNVLAVFLGLIKRAN